MDPKKVEEKRVEESTGKEILLGNNQIMYTSDLLGFLKRASPAAKYHVMITLLGDLLADEEQDKLASVCEGSFVELSAKLWSFLDQYGFVERQPKKLSEVYEEFQDKIAAEKKAAKAVTTFICECGRNFDTKRGLGKHRSKCKESRQ